MRIESSVTSISWIPSEAVRGMTRLPFEMGVAHYDEPPPDHVDDLDALREADRFRFANRLSAWIDVEGGRITGHGYSGGGHIGSTTMRLAGKVATFAAVAFPDRQQAPVVSDDSVRFVQTSGGRTGVPAPRRVKYPPFVQVSAPLAWTTLALTLHADGSSEHEVIGASPFPRHWIYDHDGRLVLKSGLVDFKDWYSARLRLAHAVGRRGLARAGQRGGDRAGARALRPHHARRRQAAHQPRWPRARPWSTRATRAATCSWCSTAWCRSR